MNLDLYNNEAFESIKRVDEDGNEYWVARELQKVLEYKEWRKFEGVINRAKDACINGNNNELDHFVDTDKKVQIGSGANRIQKNYKLTRYAFYLIAQNEDTRKTVIVQAEGNIHINKELLNNNIAGNTALTFSKQVDLWSKGKWNNQANLVLLKHTPQSYIDLGLSDNPITVTSNKMDRIVNKIGNQKDTYHGLGVDTVKQIPNAISNPLNILDSSTRDNSIVVITELTDKDNNLVVVSMLIDGKGRIEICDVNNNFKIKNVNANVATSAYGRNNYDNWIEKNKDNLVYDKDDGIIKKELMANGYNSQTTSIPMTTIYHNIM